MRRKHLVAATAVTLAALLVLSNASQVATAVVCVGLNGHVAVESTFEGCCISYVAGVRGDDVELSTTGSSCGSCTDVQLKAQPLRSDETQPFQPGSDVGCAVCSLCFSAGAATRTADAIVLDQRWRALAPLSTVVLLT